MNPVTLNRLIETALEEDLGWGDLSTESVLPTDEVRGRASITSRVDGVIAGGDIAGACFRYLDPNAIYTPLVPDGERCQTGARVATVEGSARALLSGERVALNFLARLSGIATATRRMVDAVGDLDVKIIDTRKTTPGLRAIEKYAVRMGGGFNHRFDLSSAVLLKENHLRAAGGITSALHAVHARVGHAVLVQVEVVDLAGVREALEAGADALLLDNMPPEGMREAIDFVRGRIPLEASGGISEETLLAAADTGVDLISMGSLTHSVRALDMSMILEAICR